MMNTGGRNLHVGTLLDSATLRRVLAEPLAAAGFTQRSSIWFVPDAAVVPVVQLVKTHSLPRWYVNLALWRRDMGDAVPVGSRGATPPRPEDCGMHGRAESVLRDHETYDLLAALAGQRASTRIALFGGLRTLVVKRIVPFFRSMPRESGDLAAWIERNDLVRARFVTERVRERLGLPAVVRQ
jgi:hypothetical protein